MNSLAILSYVILTPHRWLIIFVSASRSATTCLLRSTKPLFRKTTSKPLPIFSILIHIFLKKRELGAWSVPCPSRRWRRRLEATFVPHRSVSSQNQDRPTYLESYETFPTLGLLIGLSTVVSQAIFQLYAPRLINLHSGTSCSALDEGLSLPHLSAQVLSDLARPLCFELGRLSDVYFIESLPSFVMTPPPLPQSLLSPNL